MRLLSWTLTIVFALAGLALRADGGWLGLTDPRLVDSLATGCFLFALLTCPFLWARAYGLMPRPLQVPAKERMLMGLALVLAAPLLLPWH